MVDPAVEQTSTGTVETVSNRGTMLPETMRMSAFLRSVATTII